MDCFFCSLLFLYEAQTETVFLAMLINEIRRIRFLEPLNLAFMCTKTWKLKWFGKLLRNYPSVKQNWIVSRDQFAGESETEIKDSTCTAVETKIKIAFVTYHNSMFIDIIPVMHGAYKTWQDSQF